MGVRLFQLALLAWVLSAMVPDAVALAAFNSQDECRKDQPRLRESLVTTDFACPCCGHAPVARIMYGLPHFDENLEKALADGRIALGGCVVGEDDPAWQCTACGKLFWPLESRWDDTTRGGL